MQIASLPSPAILIEKSRLDANIARMQAKANANNVHLRPHTKTHKSVIIARQQVDEGAKGLTVAKTGEADVYARSGFKDLRIAYELIGRQKYEEIRSLMDNVRVSFCVDTEVGARDASAFFEAAGVQAEVLVEVDTGYGRCGVRWDRSDSIDFVRLVDDLPGLKLTGLLTHFGQSYKGPSEQQSLEDALKQASIDERDRMLAFASDLHQAGVRSAQPNTEEGNDLFEISIGSTPSMRYFENRTHNGFTITEIRPGNYVFNDAIQEALGAAELAECALTVQATVISKHRNSNGSERLFLDAGRKMFTSDAGYKTDGFGILMYNTRHMKALPHARITGLSEEHGWVNVSGGSTMDVGSQVRVVPNHACVVVNNQDHLYLVDGNEVVEKLSVDARGHVW
ncbi:MAG: alanine racemase [Rhodothermaceae bacterium]|nr:alanine racemase [Rhodothermaceae bacterium]